MNNFKIFSLAVVIFNCYILNVFAQYETDETVSVYFYSAMRNKCLRTSGLPNSTLTYGACDNSDNTVWIIPNSHSGNYRSKVDPDYCLSIDNGTVSLKECSENTNLYRDGNFIKSPLYDNQCIGSANSHSKKISLKECADEDWDQVWFFNIFDPSIVIEDTPETVTVQLYNVRFNGCIYNKGTSVTTGPCCKSQQFNNEYNNGTLISCTTYENSLWEIPISHYGNYRSKSNPEKCLGIKDGKLILIECEEDDNVLYRDGNFIKSPQYDDSCITTKLELSESCDVKNDDQIWYFNIIPADEKTVIGDYDLPFEYVPTEDIEKFELNEKYTISSLNNLKNLKTLIISDYTLKQDDVDILCSLNKLEELHLRTGFKKGVDTKCFKNLIKLSKLNIERIPLTQEIINVIGSADSIKEFTIFYSTEFDKGLNFEQKLENITRLEFRDTSNNDGEFLKLFPNLESLFLSVDTLTQKYFEIIIDMKNLKNLYYNVYQNSNVNFETLTGTSNLTYLYSNDSGHMLSLTPNFFKIFSQLETLQLNVHIYNQKEIDGFKTLKNLKKFNLNYSNLCEDNIPLDLSGLEDIIEDFSIRPHCIADTTSKNSTTSSSATETISSITIEETETTTIDPVPSVTETIISTTIEEVETTNVTTTNDISSTTVDPVPTD